MDISEFKAQNPDYKDVPDVVLADALHAKFYSEVPREQFLQQVGVAGPGGNFATSMPRADYAKQFMANNPQAGQDALDMALAQYDKTSGERTQAAGNAVQDKFAQLRSPEATFNARLNERLRGDRDGVVPQLPGRIEPDAPVAPAASNPSTFDTVAGNLVGGAFSTLVGAGASGARLLGNSSMADEWDQGRAQIQARQKELGGDTFTGKVAGMVGGIVPALAVPEDMVSQLVANAGLFAKPAFDDTLKAKLAEGYSRPLALAHAAEAFGINLFLPTVASRGSGAIINGLGQAEAAGLRGAAVGLGQAAGEGVGFSALNSVADKGTDVLAGQKNDRAWLDPEDMAVQAAGFGALRAGHMVTHAAGGVVDAVQQARARAALIADIGKASTVDEAIAAANAAVNATSPSDTVADMLQKIRPLSEEAAVVPVESVEPPGRIEPTLGDTGAAGDLTRAADAAPARPELEGIDLTAGQPDPDAPPVWRPRDALDRVIDPNGDWHAFPPETGTLGVPRETMPQIKAEHRGALTNFLNARGIEHEQVEVPAESLKPTQAEFSLDKVLKAKEFEGGNRSILISSDGYVLDGHHQWLAAVDAGEPVKAIRLDAPIASLLETVKEFPSATVADGAPAAEPTSTSAPTESVHPVTANGIYRDGGKWKVEYSTKKRTDGSVALVRTITNSDGPRVEHLGNDGTWKKGEPASVAVFGAHVEDYAPETFPTVGHAMDAARDDANDMGGKISDHASVALPESAVAVQADHLEAARQKHARQDEAVKLANQSTTARKAARAAAVEAEKAKLSSKAEQVEPVAEPGAVVEIKDVYGRTHRVLQSDLAGEADRISTIRKNGDVLSGEEIPRSIIKPAGEVVPTDIKVRQNADELSTGPKDIGQQLDAKNNPEGEAGMPARAGAVESPPSPESVSQKHDSVIPSGKESVDDIPLAFQKKVKVPHDVWIEDEGKFETVDMPAHKALKSAREDIDSLTALLNCLGE